MMLVCLAFCFLVCFPSHSSQLTSKTVKPLNKDRRSEIELKDMRVFALQTEEESILKLTISTGDDGPLDAQVQQHRELKGNPRRYQDAWAKNAQTHKNKFKLIRLASKHKFAPSPIIEYFPLSSKMIYV